MQRRLHAVLAGVALASWLLFILACTGASWSPDGSKVLFWYQDPAAKQFGVALHDVSAGTTIPLLLHAQDDSGSIVSAQWQRDGSRALIFTYPSGDSSANLSVLSMPVGGAGTVRQFSLPGMKHGHGMLPFPEIDGQLYLDGDYLARLNLETGEVKIERPKTALSSYLFSDGSRLFAIRFSAADSPTKVYTVGEVDLATLLFRRRFELRPADVSAPGIEVKGIHPVPAVEPHSGRFALVVVGDGKDAILLCSLLGVERALRPNLALERYALATLEWSRDGQLLYAVVASESADGKSTELRLAEIPLDGAGAHLTLIARLSSGDLDELRGWLPLALSPDGGTLALPLTPFDAPSVAPQERALYLIHLREPERPIRKILAPVAQQLALPPPPPPPPEPHP